VPLGIRAIRWDAEHGLFVNGAISSCTAWARNPPTSGRVSAPPSRNWMHFYTSQLMKDAGATSSAGATRGGPAQIAASEPAWHHHSATGRDGEHDTVGGAWTLRAAEFPRRANLFPHKPVHLHLEGGNQKVTREHARELRGLLDKYDPHGERAFAFRRADAITAEVMDIGIGTEGGREIARLPVVEANMTARSRRGASGMTPRRRNFGLPRGQGPDLPAHFRTVRREEVGQYVKSRRGEPRRRRQLDFLRRTSGGRVAVEVARVSGEWTASACPRRPTTSRRAMFRADPQVHIIGHWSYPPAQEDVYVAANGDDVGTLPQRTSLGHGKVSDPLPVHFPNVTFARANQGRRLARWPGHRHHDNNHCGRRRGAANHPLLGPGGLRADAPTSRSSR